VTAIDIFCGAGGLTRGLLDAGIAVGAGYDIDEDCRFPYEANNGVPFVRVDVKELEPEDVREALGEEPNLVAGCAPCQPYSIMTHGRAGTEESRGHLLSEFSRIVMQILPTYVTMENVPGLTRREAFRAFVAELWRNGYWVDWEIVDSSRYGVPQRRHRLILMASRMAPIRVPPRRHGRPPGVRGAIGRLPRLMAGESHSLDPLHRAAHLADVNLSRIQASGPGGTWLEWPSELRLRCHSRPGGRGYTHSYGRMRWGAPSPPITTKFYNFGSGRFGHPEQNRALSLREGALLQTFPASYAFQPPGDKLPLASVGGLIGNAVPVKLAHAVGSTIQQHAAICFR